MKATSKEIDYKGIPCGKTMTIPKGTPVIEATNLPYDGAYWCEPWEGMTDEEESWQRNYGFMVSEEEVEEIS